MRRVAIYDPTGTPKHWTDLIRPGQFAVFLFDVYTSTVVHDHADPSGSADSCYFFDSLKEAKLYCEALVRRREDVRCEIFDERGMAAQPLYTFFHPRHEHRVGSKRTARLLMLGGLASLAASSPLFWFDWRADGARIWPTIFGINLVFLGLRLLYWGYGMIEEFRRQEKETAEVEAQQAKGPAE